MDWSLTVVPSDFAAALANDDTLTDTQKTAVSAAWAATDTTLAPEYELHFAASTVGGWTVVRVAAFHKAE